MDDSSFEKLLAKLLLGELTPQENKQLDAAISDDAQRQYEYELVLGAGQEQKNDSGEGDESWRAHLEKYQEILEVDKQAQKSFFKRNYGKIIMAAAIVIGAIILIPGLFSNKGKDDVFYYTKDNEQKTIRLPDSSLVILDANSSIGFSAASFNKTDRSIKMTGQAYFDVERNIQLPFSVHADNVDIRVLGTAFNVKAYKEMSQIETSLFRGKIEMVVRSENGQKAVARAMLAPDEKAVVMRNKTLVNKEAGSEANPNIEITHIAAVPFGGKVITKDTAWLQKQIILDNQPLSTFTQDLSNRYGKAFVIRDSSVGSYIYSGSIPTVSMDKVLEALSSIQPFHYKINQDEVIITK